MTDLTKTVESFFNMPPRDTSSDPLQAAIERLEEIRDAATDGDWQITIEGIHAVSDEHRYGSEFVGSMASGADERAVVAAYALIDPVLALLRRYQEYPDIRLEEAVMNLAKAVGA
ncbi:hypothetical protein [Agromyces aureus]|uniref:Uncharacterized protein n=1 Tax=Agromyces aureus TaxID=453304 RepID=A0A191WET4_9MICO|nr:hypothetical protein [Agromyces aureus]ANJ26785.1 hypothetical protein ATC03_08730 [Agromyces aureus]